MKTNLLHDIEQFISETGVSEYTFGFAAIKNGRLVERLREGRRVWPDTEQKVRAYITSERRKAAKVRQAENA